MAPSKPHIAEIFAHLGRGDVDGFFQHVDPNVGTYVHVNPQLEPPLPIFEPRIAIAFPHNLCDISHETILEWTVQSHSTLGGTYHSTQEFRSKTFARLAPIMDDATPMRQRVTNIIGGGDDEWCTVEMVNETRTKSGDAYNQRYAWCCRWAEQGGEWKIVQVRAYLDTGLVDRVIAANEK